MEYKIQRFSASIFFVFNKSSLFTTEVILFVYRMKFIPFYYLSVSISSDLAQRSLFKPVWDWINVEVFAPGWHPSLTFVSSLPPPSDKPVQDTISHIRMKHVDFYMSLISSCARSFATGMLIFLKYLWFFFHLRYPDDQESKADEGNAEDKTPQDQPAEEVREQWCA